MEFRRQQGVHFRPVAHGDLDYLREMDESVAIDCNGHSICVPIYEVVKAVVGEDNKLHPCSFEVGLFRLALFVLVEVVDL